MKQPDHVLALKFRLERTLRKIPDNLKNKDLREGLEKNMKKLGKSSDKENVMQCFLNSAGLLNHHIPEPFKYQWQERVFETFSGGSGF